MRGFEKLIIALGWQIELSRGRDVIGHVYYYRACLRKSLPLFQS